MASLKLYLSTPDPIYKDNGVINATRDGDKIDLQIQGSHILTKREARALGAYLMGGGDDD